VSATHDDDVDDVEREPEQRPITRDERIEWHAARVAFVADEFPPRA
jgi:hypothetical protein